MRVAILGGSFAGKSTAHRAGKAYDLEEDQESYPEYDAAKTAYKKAMSTGMAEPQLIKLDTARRKAYNNALDEALRSDRPAILGHFSPGLVKRATASGRKVKLVVLEGQELRRRIRSQPNLTPEETMITLSRSAALAEQLANLIHWNNTDGKWVGLPIYQTIDAALQ